MKKIENMTPTELRKLADDLEAEERLSKAPKVLPDKERDYNGLIRTCKSYIDEELNDDDNSSDTIHYIFEEAMQAIYGHDIFKTLGKLKKNS